MSFIIFPLSKSSLVLLRIIFFLQKFIEYFNCLLIRNDALSIELIFFISENYNIVTSHLVLLPLLLLLLLIIIYLSICKLFCHEFILFIILIKLIHAFKILLVVNLLWILMSLRIIICKIFIKICFIRLNFILLLGTFDKIFPLFLLARLLRVMKYAAYFIFSITSIFYWITSFCKLISNYYII